MIQAIAIDDEPMALQVIQSHAAKVSFIDLKATFESATEALLFLEQNPVELVFLDINMPDITGLDLSRLLPASTAFIFTTAYSEYAVDAFQLNALDYLLKPIDLHRFVQACQKAHRAVKQTEATSEYLFVKDGYDWVRVSVADLLYVESEGNYLTFKEKNRQTLTRMTLTEVQKMLPGHIFLKIHKSYLVNLNHIQKIERHQVTVANGDSIPLSASNREPLLEALRRV